jgi:metal-responsive CopG/Arc/MetJ family transcriptional regulator
MSNEKTRINLNVPQKLVNRIDERAKIMGLNKTSVIIMALNTYLDQQDMLELTRMQQLNQ